MPQLDLNRFAAIISQQRAGSHLIGWSLDSHPDIRYLDEVFRKVWLDRHNVPHIPETEEELIDYLRHFEVSNPNILLVLDLKYTEITAFIEQFLKRIKVIQLIRRDLDRLLFSWLLNRFYLKHPDLQKQGKIPCFVVNEAELNQQKEKIRESTAKYAYLADLELIYEEITNDNEIRELPDEVAKKLCKFLEVKQQPLTINRRKESPRDIQLYSYSSTIWKGFYKTGKEIIKND